jgi:hypothetical protein
MPRKPTRSSNSNRPTRKNLDRRLDDVTEEDYGDLDRLTLAELLNYETERVNDEVIRIVETGELRRSSKNGENNLGDLWRGELKGDAPGDTEEKTT